MHDNVLLNGPVWLFAQFVILAGLLLSIYVFADSLRPARRATVAGRLPEPLWLYSALTGAYLALLIVIQLIPGLQLAAAIVSIATPFALVLGVTYLLRAVFPRPSEPIDPADAEVHTGSMNGSMNGVRHDGSGDDLPS